MRTTVVDNRPWTIIITKNNRGIYITTYSTQQQQTPTDDETSENE